MNVEEMVRQSGANPTLVIPKPELTRLLQVKPARDPLTFGVGVRAPSAGSPFGLL